MANVVSTITVHNNAKYLVVKFLGLLDTSNESAVAKVTKSSFTGTQGTEPSYFRLHRAEFVTNGLSVVILGDAVPLCRLGGSLSTASGAVDYSDMGGLAISAAGATGNIALTTLGTPAVTASYDVTLWLQKVGSI